MVVFSDGQWRSVRRRAVVEGYVPGSPVENLLGIRSNIAR
ncbi:hypothetical protein N602_26785 [Mycobacterium avium subsp. hominissuis 10-5606]|nr:hypothetical protein N602_26785 [Mycobacterium avium subsp. hominissuis 10-5606]